ncbi:MAG: hypothetical protein LBM93_00305, partial [Oscillospiraceae bacterium]|nr:hypothetical protein [Oscillospiraceae bacterium]
MISYFFEFMASIAECLITVFFLNNFIGNNKSNKKNKNSLIYSSLLFLLLAVDNILLGQLEGFESISLFIMIILCSLYSYLFLSKNIIKNSVCILLNFFIITGIALLTFHINSAIYGVKVEHLQSNRNILRIAMLFYSKFIYFIAVTFAITRKQKSKFKIYKNDWTIILALFISSFIVYNGIWLLSSEISPNNSYKFIFLLFGVISVNVAIVPLLSHFSKENIKKSELLLISHHIENQRNSVNIIQENYEEIRKIKHDMKTYVNSINQLISAGEISKAIELGNKTISDNLLANTDFDMLNAVLNAKVKFCQESNIDFGFLIADKISILGDTEINIVIMNLVDNAI